MLDVGEPAPEFELPNQDGETVRLADYDGQRVVVYFYPRAGTPGCTTEACEFRDAYEEFAERDVAVLGVSTDSPEELAAFAEEHDLPFELLADEEGAVASAYESYGTTEIRGDTYEIAFRNTYVVGANGTVESVAEDVTPEGHPRRLLDSLE